MLSSSKDVLLRKRRTSQIPSLYIMVSTCLIYSFKSCAYNTGCFYNSTSIFSIQAYASSSTQPKYSAINIFKDFRYNYLLTRNGAKESFEMIAVQQYKN